MTQRKTMLALVREYLNYRRKLGFKLQIEGQQLLNFAAYADRIGHQGPLTTTLILGWACLPKNGSPLYRARRVEIVRSFARYCAAFDPKTEIPAQGILGPAHCRKPPYIYTSRQQAELLEAAGELRPKGGLRPQTYITLLGLLASTGLRISEALKLTRVEVNLKEGCLRIMETKFHKSRLVPLHATTIVPLKKYIQFRDQHCFGVGESFFCSEKGDRLPYSTVRTVFKTLREKLGWHVPPDRRPPRIHDLRHTFVCQRLLQWHQEGVDVNHAISALSTYLGHAKVSDTYWYLTGIPELLALGAARFEQFTQMSGDNL